MWKSGIFVRITHPLSIIAIIDDHDWRDALAVIIKDSDMLTLMQTAEIFLIMVYAEPFVNIATGNYCVVVDEIAFELMGHPIIL